MERQIQKQYKKFEDRNESVNFKNKEEADKIQSLSDGVQKKKQESTEKSQTNQNLRLIKEKNTRNIKF